MPSAFSWPVFVPSALTGSGAGELGVRPFMTSLRKVPGKYEEGVYGVVFFDDYGYAIKVFKRRAEAPKEHLDKVFQSEMAAYTIATQHQKLRALVPEFFGTVQCSQVIDAAGNDISHEFHLSFAYKMRRVEGSFLKLGIEDTQLKAIFNEAGINHTKDASVILDGDSVKCVVDIATQEYELWHQ